jgi:hypothetical protein
MEFKGKIEEISEKQTRTFDGSDGTKQSVEFVTMVLNDGLERIACETASTNVARGVDNDHLKVGDAVHAWLITRCADQKTKDGGTFKANRTKVYHIAKIPDFPEVPPHF